MDISDKINTPTPLLNKRKSTKPFKFNRRLANRMATLSKSSLPTMVPMNSYQIIPAASIWSTIQLSSVNSMVLPTNINPVTSNVSSLAMANPSLLNPQQTVPIHSLSKPFTTPRVTTTLIPLNVCPSEYCQTVKPISRPLVQPIENRQEQFVFEKKSEEKIITHLIDDWIIKESSQPFQPKENQRITPIEQLINREKTLHLTQSNSSSFSPPTNVNQWSIDDVCSFFEHVLEKSTYESIIKEHLIDGTALLLLEDEHLVSIFKMQ